MLRDHDKNREPISIHALREEGDPRRSTYAATGEGFLSTPSARRATQDFASALQRKEISIHALREEGDAPPTSSGGRPSVFLSTPSARRATPDAAEAAVVQLFLSTPSARRATAQPSKSGNS